MSSHSAVMHNNRVAIAMEIPGNHNNTTTTTVSLDSHPPLYEALIGDRSQIEDPNPEQYEVALLIVLGTVGMVANFAILVVIMVLTNLRRASNAFLAHHCLLDLLKAGFCLPFAQTMVSDHPPLFCSMLGGSYIVLVTSSTFNLLAVVMNEAYLFSDLTLGVKDSRNYCCVVFGIFIIWFASIIMNLGVAFIPGNPIYDRRVGHCIFIYGLTRNYVLHMLWITLISMGVGMTCMYLHKFRLDIKRTSYYRLSTLVRATVTIDSKARTSSQRHASEIREKLHVEFVQRITMRKLCLLVLLVMVFIVFWYPLFFLTIVDPNFAAPTQLYKALTMLAWSNPSLSPFIIMLFIKRGRCCCCCWQGSGTGGGLDNELLAEAAALEEARCSIAAATGVIAATAGMHDTTGGGGGGVGILRDGTTTVTTTSLPRQMSSTSQQSMSRTSTPAMSRTTTPAVSRVASMDDDYQQLQQHHRQCPTRTALLSQQQQQQHDCSHNTTTINPDCHMHHNATMSPVHRNTPMSPAHHHNMNTMSSSSLQNTMSPARHSHHNTMSPARHLHHNTMSPAHNKNRVLTDQASPAATKWM